VTVGTILQSILFRILFSSSMVQVISSSESELLAGSTSRWVLANGDTFSGSIFAMVGIEIDSRGADMIDTEAHSDE
jgi:hypothetical protein